MPALHLGTLDGFCANRAEFSTGARAPEGSSNYWKSMACAWNARRVLPPNVCAHRGELDEAQKEFVESFKRATFGREEKRLGAQLDAFLDDHQEKYLSALRSDSLWGKRKNNLARREIEWLLGVKPDDSRRYRCVAAMD